MKNQNVALSQFKVGELVNAVPVYGDDFDTGDYVPSIQFQESLHVQLGVALSNFNSVVTLYNRWKQGEMKCSWSVVNELTMGTRLVSNELSTISEMCRQDRAGMIYNPLPGIYGRNLATGLTPPETDELNALLDGASPSELLTILRNHRGVWS
ncbi:hypothetical protein [Vibrio furnissii]|uniref:hypothetical protein n=1 Tax=Vibrio furnissii TaxID=29494 RepID=UPI0025745268|nr:hypothetical protein [Vibrio furnissii]WJG24294.1 hypothetical protein QSU95_17600 [Vibrio furnissii]